jgi:hypothetical protein
MAKKQKSFAEKAVKHDGKEMVHVKFVKSVASNKEGYWRFNESMISMEKGESLEATLKRLDAEANLADIEMSPAVEVAEEIPEVVVETAEAVADEATVEETEVDTVEEESVEDSSSEKGEEQVEEVTEETPEAESTEEKSE